MVSPRGPAGFCFLSFDLIAVDWNGRLQRSLGVSRRKQCTRTSTSSFKEMVGFVYCTAAFLWKGQQTHTHPNPWEDQCECHRMTINRMTGPDYAVMCNLINTHTQVRAYARWRGYRGTVGMENIFYVASYH